METNLRHPSLDTHEFTSLKGPKTPCAYRIFWYYGLHYKVDEKRKSNLNCIVKLLNLYEKVNKILSDIRSDRSGYDNSFSMSIV